MTENLMAVQSLSQLFAELVPTPASYISTCRQVESYTGDDLKRIRVAMLSSFTAEILRPYLVVEGARVGNKILIHFCPFNQIEVQVLNPASELYQANSDVIIVAISLEDISPQLVWRYTTLSNTDIEAEISTIQERVQKLLGKLRQQSDATVLLFNFALPAIVDAGFADPRLEVPQSLAISRANEMLTKLCQTFPETFIFDYARLAADFGLSNWYDAKLHSTARIPFSRDAQLELGRYLARYLGATSLAPCKCLVLDLDNTLWGGVLGEDGLGGIALGEDYPGNVYKQFQRRILSLRDQGILLAIASKNNEADVVDVFQRHPDMLLRLEDFAATEVHWKDKATSLRNIATQLNIGIDALAFFDDSPVEREWVRQNIPEVRVIDVPSDPLAYGKALEDSGAFDRLIISADDRRRADMVRETHQREQSRVESGSMEEFLVGLDMRAIVGPVEPTTLPRIVQLLAKTNQFNLTTRRHTGAQVQTMLDSGAIVRWMRVKDRFGDNGLVGVAIAVCENNDRWRIDSFLLSCRVLGRRIEEVFLAVIAQCVGEQGGKTLIGEYIPTAKNEQTATLYPSQGFQPLDDRKQYFALDLKENCLSFPPFIQVDYQKEQLV